MPKIPRDKISIAFDIHGCPQRCRHCWLGDRVPGRMDVDGAFSVFDSIKRDQGENGWHGARIEYLGVDFREPHFGNDYRELYARADAVNGCRFDIDRGFDLASLWRLARDPSYPSWLVGRGVKRVQMKVFGIGATNDFFHGRDGADADFLRATDILLENGISPRWQLYLNTRGLGELDALLSRVDRMHVRERAEAIGGEFVFHVMTFDSDGNGYANREYRLDRGDEARIPRELISETERYTKRPFTLASEAEWYASLVESEKRLSLPDDHWLWFFVDAAWDLYPNYHGPAPWWKLGNLKKDSWRRIVEIFAGDACAGLRLYTGTRVADLVALHGDPRGTKLYSSEDDYVTYIVNSHFHGMYADGADAAGREAVLHRKERT